MRSIVYYFLLAFVLLLLEATLMRSILGNLFDFIGLDSLSHICVNTSLIICLYIAQTRNLNTAVFSAFALGYLKDMLILSNGWLDPFLFVACAVISNMLRNIFLLRGSFLFMVHVSGMSVLYFLLWATFAGYIWPEMNAFIIVLTVFIPASLVNGIFSPLIYIPLKSYDLQIEKESSSGFGLKLSK